MGTPLYQTRAIILFAELVCLCVRVCARMSGYVRDVTHDEGSTHDAAVYSSNPCLLPAPGRSGSAASRCGRVRKRPRGALEVLCLVRCMWQPGRRNMQSTRGLQNMTPGPIRSAFSTLSRFSLAGFPPTPRRGGCGISLGSPVSHGR